MCVWGGVVCNLNNYGKDYTLNKQEDISGVCVCVGGVVISITMVRTIPLTNKRTSLVCVCGGGCNLNNYGKDYTLNKQEDISGVCVGGWFVISITMVRTIPLTNKRTYLVYVCVCGGGGL